MKGLWITLDYKEGDLKEHTSVHTACVPTPGERFQLLGLFSQALPNISPKCLTSCILLLACVANVFAKETSYSVAPCTTIGSLSSICFAPFVCGLNCEPVQSLRVTRESHGLSLSSNLSKETHCNQDASNLGFWVLWETVHFHILGVPKPKAFKQIKVKSLHKPHEFSSSIWLGVFS